ncbi:MAG TPA: hypothetical protein VLG13_01730, partial [Patescibacteria group bacterium]|nr:hypothetical protein [Patescibacteria group bacterium]
INEFSTSAFSGSAPQGVTKDGNGNIWFTDPGSGAVGEVTSAGVVSEYTTSRGFTPQYITLGSDGNLYFTENSSSHGEISQINPTTHAITQDATLGAFSFGVGITAGPDGNIWTVDTYNGFVLEMDISTHATTFVNVTPAGLNEIAAGADNNLWVADWGSNSIDSVSTAGVTHNYSLPTASAGIYGVTAGPDGNVWFTEQSVGKIGKIDLSTHAITEYPISPASGTAAPVSITTGADGNLWFTDQGTDFPTGGLGVMTTSGSVTEYQTPNSHPSGITDPNGTIWFAEGDPFIAQATFSFTNPTSSSNSSTSSTKTTAGAPNTGFGAPRQFSVLDTALTVCGVSALAAGLLSLYRKARAL